MSEKDKIDNLAESVKTYVNTNYELVRLEAAERVSVLGASLISNLILAVIGVLFLLFISLVAGFYFSILLSSHCLGFGVVAIIYFLAGIILYAGRKGMLEKPFRDKIARSLTIR